MSESVMAQLRTLGVAFGVAVVGLIVGVGFTLGVGGLVQYLGMDLGVPVAIVLSLVLIQGVAFGGVAIAYVKLRGVGFGFIPVRKPSFSDILWIGSGYVLALLGAFAGAVLITLTRVEAAPNRAGEIGLEHPEILLILVPASFLLIGPGEELLFRGVVQGTLRERFSATSAVIVASAFFAAVHFAALSGGTGARVVTIGVLFLPSLVFGATYELTENLAVPATIHGAYNATLFTLLYIAVRFGEMTPPA